LASSLDAFLAWWPDLVIKRMSSLQTFKINTLIAEIFLVP
jgi:hypothetical protein